MLEHFYPVNVGGRIFVLHDFILDELTALRSFFSDKKNSITSDSSLQERSRAEDEPSCPALYASLDQNEILYIDDEASDFEMLHTFLCRGQVDIFSHNLKFSDFRIILQRYQVMIPFRYCSHCFLVYRTDEDVRLARGLPPLECRKHPGGIESKNGAWLWTCCYQDKSVERGCVAAHSHTPAESNFSMSKPQYVDSQELSNIINDSCNYKKRDDASEWSMMSQGWYDG